jgi:hypothetical protein
MSERPVPEEYTQTRAQFGHRAVTTARAARSLFEDLIAGYTTLNTITNPVGKGSSSSGNPPTTPPTKQSEVTSDVDRGESADGHYPYFVYDILRAIDVLIEFTETKYL